MVIDISTIKVMAIKSISGIDAGEQGMVISHHHQGIEMVATTLEAWAQSASHSTNIEEFDEKTLYVILVTTPYNGILNGPKKINLSLSPWASFLHAFYG